MKRLTSFILVLVLAFGFVGCTNQAAEVKEQSAEQSVVVTTIKSTSEKSETPDEKKTEALRTEDGSAKYIGNKNSRKFHRVSCGVLPAEKNRVYFQSREEAIADSYKSCKKCNP